MIPQEIALKTQIFTDCWSVKSLHATQTISKTGKKAVFPVTQYHISCKPRLVISKVNNASLYF